MHSATVFFALAALASASAVAIGGAGIPVGVTADVYARPAYSTSYAVSDAVTGDQKSASETRDGDVTTGSYSLVQPDGVVRTVKYVVTPLGGFQAKVLNNGIAVSPARAVLAAAPVAVAAPALGLGINGLGVNGLGINGLALNGLGINGLALNGLGINGLALNGLGINGLGLGVNGLGINGLGINGLALNGLGGKIVG